MEPSYEVQVISEREIVYGSKQETNISFMDMVSECYNTLIYMINVIFLLIGPLVFVYIMHKLWIVGALYLCWLYYDRNQPHSGGRSLNFYRQVRNWRGRRDYYPIKLVKTAELKPDRTYLFVCVPHGIFVHGTSTNFLSNVNGFNDAYPGIKPHLIMLSGFFYLPITRDILLFLGCCAASKDGIAYILNGSLGNACVLMPGGVKESFVSTPGRYDIFLKNRKGFIKVALASGASLVPTFTFGQNDAYKHISPAWYKWIQNKLYLLFGLTFSIVKGRYIFWPLAEPANTVVGAAIRLPKIENPSDEIVDYYHSKFIVELTKLFAEYKEKYDKNGRNAVLTII